MLGRIFGSKTPPPPPPPPLPVTRSNVITETNARDAAGKLTDRDIAAKQVADAQGRQRAEQSRTARAREAALNTGTKLATIGVVAGVTVAVAKSIPVVGGAIAGAIMVMQMVAERTLASAVAQNAAKDILHDLTYSYLLFKLIDIGADKLGLVLDIEIIQEGIKEINEKINAQLSPKRGFFSKVVLSDPKLDLTELHESLRKFRENMNELYTAFDVLKETNELLPTLRDKPPKRYTRINADTINKLISFFKTVAARELTDSEVTEIIQFLEKNVMTKEEQDVAAAAKDGRAVVPDPDTFTTASQNAALVSPSSSSTLAGKKEAAAAASTKIEDARTRLYGQAPPVRKVGSDDSAVEEDRRRPGAVRFTGAGALWPPKYYRGLSTRRKGQRRREITRRAKMSHKNPAAYRPFATDRKTKRRPSSYSSRFHTKYPGVTGLPAIARATGVPLSVLEKVYDRGLAAWRTGHRPGASQHAWGMARVHSFVLHGKTWRTADADLARRNSS